MAANHTIHSGNHRHLAWDNSTPPAMTVAPGDIVQFDDLDATSGQLTAQSTVEDIRTLDFGLVNPIAGPVYVDGAEPGDALKVTLLEFQPNDWAWTAIVPGFGLLADDFPEAALKRDQGTRIVGWPDPDCGTSLYGRAGRFSAAIMGGRIES